MSKEKTTIVLQPEQTTQRDTKRIQDAIECLKGQGGGRLVFAKGVYHAGTIFLCSNLEIYLENGCEIVGSSEEKDYTLQVYCHQSKKTFWQSLFYASREKNIVFCGEGLIRGQGEKFAAGKEAFSADEQTETTALEYKVRPSLFYFRECNNIVMKGIQLLDAAQFAVLAEECRGLRFSGIDIYNRKNFNTDGIHISVGRDVTVENCTLSCGDDALVFNRSAEKILVRNCKISSRWAGVRLGPFSDGKFKEIEVSHSEIYETYGCAIKIQIGEGGTLEQAYFHDIRMWDVTGPIHIRLCHFGGWEEIRRVEDPGRIQNVVFERITAMVAAQGRPGKWEVPQFEGEKYSCISIMGLRERAVDRVAFVDCEFSYEGGYDEGRQELRLPENIDYVYPEYFLFGILPCSALYAEYVRDVKLERVKFLLQNRDTRIPFLLKEIQKMDMHSVQFIVEGKRND